MPLGSYREWAMAPLLAMACLALAAGRPHLFAVAAAALGAALAWGMMAGAVRRASGGKVRVAGRGLAARISVADLRPDALALLFGPLLRTGPARRAQAAVEEMAKPRILRSGTAENPRVIGARSVLYPVAALAAGAPAAALLAPEYGAAAALALAPAALLTAAWFLVLGMRAGERKSGVEDEMAPFAALAGIMESVGVPLFATLESAASAGAGLFPAIRREGARVRSVSALGRSPVDALMELADTHPSPIFRDFLNGYVSSFNTGGADTAAYLQDQARRLFRASQARMARYTRQADTVAQLMLTAMLLLPMMGLSMTFFAAGPAASSMMLLLTVSFPVITAVLVALVHSKQPRGGPRLGAPWVALGAAGAAGLAAWALGGAAWEVIGAGAVAGSLANMAVVRRALADADSAERHLPELMRQLTRFKNIGIDVMGSMGKMRQEAAGRPRLGPALGGVVDSIHMALSRGAPFEEATAAARAGPRSVRTVLYMLGRVHESGGGTTKTFEDITRWVTEQDDARREMVGSLRASLATAFAGPVLMVMITTMAGHISERFASGIAGAGGPGLPGLDITPPAADGLSEALTVVATVCMGVTLSKINYFTVRHTMFTGIITAVAMALLYVAPHVPVFPL